MTKYYSDLFSSLGVYNFDHSLSAIDSVLSYEDQALLSSPFTQDKVFHALK